MAKAGAGAIATTVKIEATTRSTSRSESNRWNGYAYRDHLKRRTAPGRSVWKLCSKKHKGTCSTATLGTRNSSSGQMTSNGTSRRATDRADARSAGDKHASALSFVRFQIVPPLPCVDEITRFGKVELPWFV